MSIEQLMEDERNGVHVENIFDKILKRLDNIESDIEKLKKEVGI